MNHSEGNSVYGTVVRALSADFAESCVSFDGGLAKTPGDAQQSVMRRAGSLPLFQILLDGLDVSAEVAILLSLLDIRHLVEL